MALEADSGLGNAAGQPVGRVPALRENWWDFGPQLNYVANGDSALL